MAKAHWLPGLVTACARVAEMEARGGGRGRKRRGKKKKSTKKKARKKTRRTKRTRRSETRSRDRHGRFV